MKLLGEYIYPKCVRRNGKLICHPTGRFKFRRYTWVNEQTPA